MKISSGITTYKATMPVEKPVEKAKEEVANTKEARKDTITISNKNNPLSKAAFEQIKNDQASSFNNMLSSMIGNQVNSSNINKAQSLLSKLGMGNITPEQAASNISEGGPFGVNTVATNIMNMAESLSGGDPEKMEMLREAVMDGFAAAGVELGTGSDVSGLPQVSQDTFTEVMKRFDHYAENGSLDGYEYTPYE